jgi:predicted permease
MLLDDIGRDLRHSLGILRANPTFAIVAIVTLALGIGANTAIFSVMNAVVLRALPVHDPQQLVFLRIPNQPAGASNTGNGNSSFSEAVFERLRTNRAFSDLMAYVPLGIGKVTVRSGKTPEEASVDMVSGNFFSGIGVAAVCGRPLSLDDEKNHTAAAVLSYGYWSSHFGESCDAIGKPLHIKGVPFTIVGVAAKSFSGVEGAPTEVWIPLQRRPELYAWGEADQDMYKSPTWWCLPLIGRLASGITQAAAIAQLNPVLQHSAYESLGGKPRPGEHPITLSFLPARGIAGVGEAYEKPLNVLLAMVGLVLIIACGNVSLLLAARNAARRREFSVRLALGGSRGRIFRQLLVESLLLVAAGALLGWLFAIAASNALGAWSDIQVSLEPDRRVLLFTLAISLLAGLIFGLAPLVSAVRVPIALALKTSSATAFQEKGKFRAGKVVAALQVALCLMLLAGAGLLIRTLRNLEQERLGFHADGLLVFGLSPNVHSDAEAIRFYQATLTRLTQLPGVRSASVMQNRIGSGWANNTTPFVDGKNPQERGGSLMRWNAVGPGYFKVLGIPLLYGRDFNDADSQNSAKVVIVNETFAKKLLPSRNPLGHQASFTSKLPFTIVGVAANSKYTGVREDDRVAAYFPYTQIKGIGDMHVELRTAGNPLSILPAVRKSMAEFAPNLALLQPMTQRAQFDASISTDRLVARLAVFFGGLAVLLVATGLYGTLAYTVSRRTAEMGIRMALGAQRNEVLRMILRESLVVCVAGLALGLPLVFLSTRLLQSLLFGLAPRDPLTIAAAAAGIIAVTVIASWIPARRAATIDPQVALRYE